MLHGSLSLSKGRSGARSVRWSHTPDRPPAVIGQVRQRGARWAAVTHENIPIGTFPTLHEAANALRVRLIEPLMRTHLAGLTRANTVADTPAGADRGGQADQLFAAPPAQPSEVVAIVGEQRRSTAASPVAGPPPWADGPA